MPKKIWVYDPQSGGKKIPDSIKPIIRQRILSHAQKHYAGKYNRIEVRFRGKSCYIDAYTEPFVPPDYDPELYDGKSREKRIAELREVPTHLCRLRYFGDEDKWSMAFYTYSNMKYEPSFFDNGTWHGTPEEAFDTSAVYLMDWWMIEFFAGRNRAGRTPFAHFLHPNVQALQEARDGMDEKDCTEQHR